MQIDQQVTLDNLGHGAAAELFQAELQRVIHNIMDCNTKPETARTITIKVKLTPTEQRTTCALEISCDSKLAPVRPYNSTMFVDIDHGTAVAMEHDPQQMRLQFPEEPEGNVRQFTKVK